MFILWQLYLVTYSGNENKTITQISAGNIVLKMVCKYAGDSLYLENCVKQTVVGFDSCVSVQDTQENTYVKESNTVQHKL